MEQPEKGSVRMMISRRNIIMTNNYPKLDNRVYFFNDLQNKLCPMCLCIIFEKKNPLKCRGFQLYKYCKHALNLKTEVEINYSLLTAACLIQSN